MAEIFLDGDTVHVCLGSLERVGALRGDAHFPIASVRAARVSENPFDAVRGIRAPGTGLPGVVALGTWRSHAHGTSIVAAYRGRPALVLDVDGERFERVVVSTDDAHRLAGALAGDA